MDTGRDRFEPHWPGDSDLLGRAVKMARDGKPGKRPRWSHVAHSFICGSSVAHALCRRYGLDVDEMLGGR